MEPSPETTNTFSVNGFTVTTTSSNILSRITITEDINCQIITNIIKAINMPPNITQERPRKLRKTHKQPRACSTQCKRFIVALREYFAEFLGTLILFLFGLAGTLSALQTTLSEDEASQGIKAYIGVFSWSIGVFSAVLVASNASDAHLNPAVTLMQTLFRKFSWKKALGYILAQFLGALAGTSIAYGLLHDTIKAHLALKNNSVWDYDTLGPMLYTSPAPGVSVVTALFNEGIASGLLGIIILSQSSRTVCEIRKYLSTGFTALAVAGLSLAFGHNTGGAMNPWRDLVPRVVARACRWEGTAPFGGSPRYWPGTTIAADLVGMLVGAFVFQLLVTWPGEWAVLPEGDLGAGGGEDESGAEEETAADPPKYRYA